MSDIGVRTIAASTVAELETLFSPPEPATYRSNAELTGAARVVLRFAFLSVTVTLIAQGILLLAAAGTLGRLTFFPTPLDLRRVAQDPVWVMTGVVTDVRGEVFLLACVIATLTIIPVFLAWLSRAFTNARALGSDAELSPEDAVLRAFAGSAGSIWILLLALSFGTWWARALLAIVLPGAGFVVTFLVLRQLWIAQGGDRRTHEQQWRVMLLSPGVALGLYLLALVAQAGSISAFDCGWPCKDTEALIATAGSPSTFEQLTRDHAYRAWAHALNARYVLAGLLSIAAGVFLIPVGLAAAGAIRHINSIQAAAFSAVRPGTRTDDSATPSPALAGWACQSCGFYNSSVVSACNNCDRRRQA